MDTFPSEYREFEKLAAAAFQQWCPDASLSFQRMSPGLSGAVVLRVNISGADALIEPGQYVVKLSPADSSATNEVSAYQFVFNANRAFAEAHIPRVERQYATELGRAVLFDIAGRSLDSYRSVDGPENICFETICCSVVRDLLDNWTRPHPEPLAPHELFERWLGERVSPEGGKNVHAAVADIFNTHLDAVIGRRAVFNPLAIYQLSKKSNWDAIESLPAMVHGDLHGGNVLAHRADPKPEDYWVIDVTHAREAPAGFDQAYFELAFLLDNLREADPVQLLAVLEAVESTNPAAALLPPTTRWLVNTVRAMRNAIAEWQQAAHPRLTDPICRQFVLARVAAGLNWGNKRLLGEMRRLLAVAYASWHAAKYVERYESGRWPTRSNKKEHAQPEGLDNELWRGLWKLAGGFTPTAGRFILIAEALGDAEGLKALGHLPWSAIIDLDPKSDEAGLYAQAAQTLETRRSIHLFSKSLMEVNFNRGTAWLMSAGWNRKREPSTTYSQWRHTSLPLIRQLVRSVYDSANPEPVFVVMLPGATLDPEMPLQRFGQIAAAIDESTTGQARIILLGGRDLPERIEHEHIELEVDAFIANLEVTFGTSAVQQNAHIPGGGDGIPRQLPIEALRSIEENLEVLHSRILDQPHGQSAESDAFWRGRPPGWMDFVHGLDIERDINATLIDTLRQKLKEIRNQTVVLYHTPGSGATTAALRAAWDLRTEYPTAILRNHSPALFTRLQNLYLIAERPILLVAEASDLKEPAREDLYRELSLHNCRVVLLYIRRVLHPGEEKKALVMSDPMVRTEAVKFLSAYQRLTRDPNRRQELARITHHDALEKYRSPFFYGLITYERDFEPVERYVSTHIHGAHHLVRDVLQYLAITTIFSNTGLHEGIIRRLFGMSHDSPFSISEILGDGPARLIVSRDGRMRLMHQIIAEEVLATLRSGPGEDWMLDLHTLTIEMIRNITAAIGPDSVHVVEMFRQLFVDRQGRHVDDAEDRMDFSPLIEMIDQVNPVLGHAVFQVLTDCCPAEPHFWNHFGRHQIYRMNRDIERAEEYLGRAIQLSPNDFLHYHTRGLVRRARLRVEMRKLHTSNVDVLVERLAIWFDAAALDFEHTRELAPENMYGYVTHIQMILDVATRLKSIADVENIAAIRTGAARWLQENITIATRLLDDAHQLYGTLDQQDSYLTQCAADLQTLYGNIEDVIQIWELAQARGANDPYSRRALAAAYVSRSDNSWSQMDPVELRRIVELMEMNLNARSRTDDDYRIWFEAYKLLPEFDTDHALGRLRIWSERFPSWRAYFYTYVLHFLLWFEGRTNSTVEMERALESCQKFAVGRRGMSHQWFGNVPDWCPLVSSSDLGEWSRGANFWRNTALLRRINGMIDEEIRGPQSGRILIDGKMPVFFVPASGDFFANRDENQPVNFFLGFSAAGLRAWEVRRQHVANGDRNVLRPQEGVQLIALPPAPVAAERKQQRIRRLSAARVQKFVQDLVKAHLHLGASITVDEVVRRVDAAFGVEHVMEDLHVDVREALAGHYRLVEEGPNINIEEYAALSKSEVAKKSKTGRIRAIFTKRRGDKKEHFNKQGYIEGEDGIDVHFQMGAVVMAHRKLIEKGRQVEYVEESGPDGPVATHIRLIDVPAVVEGDKLKDAIREATLRALRNAPKHELPLHVLYKRLQDELPGPRLTSRMGVSTMGAVLGHIGEVMIEGSQDHRRVRLREDDGVFTFGQLPITKGKPLASLPKSAAKPETKSPPKNKEHKKKTKSLVSASALSPTTNEQLRVQVREEALNFVREKGGEVLGSTLGWHLHGRFGPSRELMGQLGYKTFRKMIDDIDQLESVIIGALHIVRSRVTGETMATNDVDADMTDPDEPVAVVMEPDDLGASVMRETVQVLETTGAMGIDQLGQILRAKFPSSRPLAHRLGHKTLTRFFEKQEELIVQPGEHNPVVSRRTT